MRSAADCFDGPDRRAVILIGRYGSARRNDAPNGVRSGLSGCFEFNKIKGFWGRKSALATMVAAEAFNSLQTVATLAFATNKLPLSSRSIGCSQTKHRLR